MSQITEDQIKVLRPFLIGEEPGEDGEWGMYCPLHPDRTRSASLNVNKGMWYCQAQCGGGTIEQLVDAQDTFVPAKGRVNPHANPSRSKKNKPVDKINKKNLRRWHRALMGNEVVRERLMEARGVSEETLRRWGIGWDAKNHVYTIPVLGPKGTIWNVRRYDMRPRSGRRKMWGVKGMNDPRLFPFKVARSKQAEKIIICEGEWDALLTLQHDFAAVTRTASAVTWKQEWNKYFKDKVVYLAHDCDWAGQEANQKVAEALEGIAAEIRVLSLPYPIIEKHGKDLTDFWLEYSEHAASEMTALMDDAEIWSPDHHGAVEEVDAADASVLDSFDAHRVGQPMRLTVTVKGKRDPGWSVPRNVAYRCNRDAGSKCNFCPLNQLEGEDDIELPGHDPVVLEMIDSSSLQLFETLRRYRDIPKCSRVNIEALKHQAVETLFARPSIDHVQGDAAGDYKTVRITSVGRHDTLPNNTVQVVGALYPDPRSQGNHFQAWDVSVMETSLDAYDLDERDASELKVFRPDEGQRPLAKLAEIAKTMSEHVTKIYGRPEMHAAMDLVFHSALSFKFGRQYIDRGWLELLVVGDTRTGKSEAANLLSRHYGVGEVVSCESASFAGVIGGLQQFGSGKEWAVSWGAIPINDRRLVVLDEVGGLATEEIGRMSSVRSSGMAELTKIQNERTHARTRLIWLGNPRSGRMSNYTYGVQAIRPLIGNDEDIARFDLAMCVVAEDVPARAINQVHNVGGTKYSSDLCNMLVRWCWSRRPDQIKWVQGAQDAVMEAANKMGTRYIEDPPLVQAANVRVKIARVAVAMAMRLFSTDADFENVLVRREHVEDAVAFLDKLYSMRSFGYKERSQERIQDRLEAEDHRQYMERYLEKNPGLAKFLRSAGGFRSADVEQVMNIDRSEANAIVHTLWDKRMVRKERGDLLVEPTLHSILRSIKA